MRKKIITVAATLLLLGLLSMVEQLRGEADERGDGENAGDSLSAGAE